jgi:hypothetical protein
MQTAEVQSTNVQSTEVQSSEVRAASGERQQHQHERNTTRGEERDGNRVHSDGASRARPAVNEIDRSLSR